MNEENVVKCWMTGKKYSKAFDYRQMFQTSLNLVNE